MIPSVTSEMICRLHMKRCQPLPYCFRKQLHQKLHIALQPVTNRKCQKKDQSHDTKENGDSPDPVRQEMIHLIRKFCFLCLIHHNFFYNLLDKVILLIDDICLIAPIQYIRQFYRIFGRDLPDPVPEALKPPNDDW